MFDGKPADFFWTALNNKRAADSAVASSCSWRARAEELELELKSKKAHIGGLQAYLDAFKKAHPNSPVRKETGMRFKDGSPKMVGSMIYIEAFDRIAKGLGLANPAQYRAD